MFLIFMGSSSNELAHLKKNSKTDVSVGFQWPFVPIKGTLTCRPLTKPFCILSSFISQILDLIYSLVCIFTMGSMTVKVAINKLLRFTLILLASIMA